MSNENLLSTQTLSEHYMKYAAENGLSLTTFSLNLKDCVVLPPYINQEDVRKAKEDFVNCLNPLSKQKAVVINVPMLILYGVESNIDPKKITSFILDAIGDFPAL